MKKFYVITDKYGAIIWTRTCTRENAEAAYYRKLEQGYISPRLYLDDPDHGSKEITPDT